MKQYLVGRYDIQELHDDKEFIAETNLDEFFKELFALYEKYNISISTADQYVGFMLEKNKWNNRESIERADAFHYIVPGDRTSGYADPIGGG